MAAQHLQEAVPQRPAGRVALHDLAVLLDVRTRAQDRDALPLEADPGVAQRDPGKPQCRHTRAFGPAPPPLETASNEWPIGAAPTRPPKRRTPV